MHNLHRVLFGCFFVLLSFPNLPVLGQSKEAQPPQDAPASSNFDEKFDHWPTELKIGGTVILGGGGKLPQQAKSAFATATKGNKQVAAVVFQPSSPDADSKQTVTELKKRFTAEKSSNVWLVEPSQTSLSKEAVDLLASADGLWVIANSDPTESQEKAIEQLLTAAAKLIDRGGTVCVNGNLAERFGKFDTNSLKSDPPKTDSKHRSRFDHKNEF